MHELVLGPNDLLLGQIAGCPFDIDRELYRRWTSPRLMLDVAPGGRDSFSLEGPDGVHFGARTPAA